MTGLKDHEAAADEEGFLFLLLRQNDRRYEYTPYNGTLVEKVTGKIFMWSFLAYPFPFCVATLICIFRATSREWWVVRQKAIKNIEPA